MSRQESLCSKHYRKETLANEGDREDNKSLQHPPIPTPCKFAMDTRNRQ